MNKKRKITSQQLDVHWLIWKHRHQNRVDSSYAWWSRLIQVQILYYPHFTAVSVYTLLAKSKLCFSIFYLTLTMILILIKFDMVITHIIYKLIGNNFLNKWKGPSGRRNKMLNLNCVRLMTVKIDTYMIFFIKEEAVQK